MMVTLFRLAFRLGVFALVVNYVREQKQLSVRNPRAYVDTKPGPSA